MSNGLTCPAGIITNERLLGCDLILGHEGAHYAQIDDDHLHWWGAVEAADEHIEKLWELWE